MGLVLKHFMRDRHFYVGDDAMTATGSVVTVDVPDAAMAVARAKQVNKPGFAVRLFDRLKAAKAARDKG